MHKKLIYLSILGFRFHFYRFREEMLTFDESDLAESTLQVLQSYIDRPHFAPMYLGERTQNQAINSLVLYVRGVVR